MSEQFSLNQQQCTNCRSYHVMSLNPERQYRDPKTGMICNPCPSVLLTILLYIVSLLIIAFCLFATPIRGFLEVTNLLQLANCITFILACFPAGTYWSNRCNHIDSYYSITKIERYICNNCGKKWQTTTQIN